jgi:hypothetical protein
MIISKKIILNNFPNKEININNILYSFKQKNYLFGENCLRQNSNITERRFLNNEI